MVLATMQTKYGEDQILYIDESGMNTNEVHEYGWSAKGKRCHTLKSDGYGKRLNIIKTYTDFR